MKKTINKGDELVLTVNVKPQNADNLTVIWSSSNDNIATVDQSGKLIAKTEGTVLIRATATGNTAVFDEIAIEVIDDHTGVTKQSSHKIHLYPNPASNFICLAGLDSKHQQIAIFNAQGTLVKHVDIYDTGDDVSINVSDLASGLHVLKPANDVSGAIKFVKK